MDVHGTEWKDVENKLRRQWLNSNNNPSLSWEDVRESVKFGWMKSNEDQRYDSIH